MIPALVALRMGGIRAATWVAGVGIASVAMGAEVHPDRGPAGTARTLGLGALNPLERTRISVRRVSRRTRRLRGHPALGQRAIARASPLLPGLSTALAGCRGR
jgi:hypothetical protein